MNIVINNCWIRFLEVCVSIQFSPTFFFSIRRLCRGFVHPCVTSYACVCGGGGSGVYSHSSFRHAKAFPFVNFSLFYKFCSNAYILPQSCFIFFLSSILSYTPQLFWELWARASSRPRLSEHSYVSLLVGAASVQTGSPEGSWTTQHADDKGKFYSWWPPSRMTLAAPVLNLSESLKLGLEGMWVLFRQSASVWLEPTSSGSTCSHDDHSATAIHFTQSHLYPVQPHDAELTSIMMLSPASLVRSGTAFLCLHSSFSYDFNAFTTTIRSDLTVLLKTCHIVTVSLTRSIIRSLSCLLPWTSLSNINIYWCLCYFLTLFSLLSFTLHLHTQTLILSFPLTPWSFHSH